MPASASLNTVLLRSNRLSSSQTGRYLLSLSAGLLLLAAAVPPASAQATPAAKPQVSPMAELDELAALSAASAINDSGPEGIVPAIKGFNPSLGTSSQHDSSNGWSSILTPNAAYRFNKYFSVDAGVPIYTYINIYFNYGTAAKPDYHYAVQGGTFGDTAMSFEGDAY